LDWSTPTTWWLAAGVLAAAELVTGSFYLLMLALGAAVGALAAHAGLSATTQLLLAALLGTGATLGWHLVRARLPQAKDAGANPDVNIDIGQTVHVLQWQADGTSRVPYRGAQWQVRLAPGAQAASGVHTIVALRGTELLLSPASEAVPVAEPGAAPQH
jgi:membrane protein implicated in regulation of membrane protease activity